MDALFEGPYREAHAKAQAVLAPLAGDRAFFEEIVLECASRPGFFSQGRINPVVAFNLLQTPHYSLIAHGWIPRPDGDTTISHQSIHHHGKLLLTSLAAFGAGYESLLFKRGFTVDKKSREAELKPQKLYVNSQGSIEFVDSFAPHVVFYPKEISVTYALWSNDTKTLGANAKKNPLLRRLKAPLKSCLLALGLGEVFGLNAVEDLDFTVNEGKAFLLPKRVTYPRGGQQNFHEALFLLLDKIGFERREELYALAVKTKDEALIQASDRFRKRQPFKNEFEPSHLMLKDANLRRDEVLRCFGIS